jgi:acid phosphatase (class A)
MSRLSCFALLACLAGTLAHAEFLPSPALDYRTIVPPPPAAGSVAEEADRTAAWLFTSQRTPEQTALAHHFERIDIFKMMQPVLGEWATAQNLPALARFIQAVLPEVRPITEAAKNAYARPRPHVDLPGLALAYAEKPDGFTYPSGHATGSAMYAALLSAIVPEHAAEWERQAELVRLSRLYGGAHYLSDVIAGRRLGEATAAELLKTEATRRAIEEIRAELARVRAAQRRAA